ncbi:MAG: aldehyde dehydrogenase family protein, partial [Rhodobacteraceae bacterium]|nr:aldehyde dehydrogenase family protein [Paracoccaceae bacterium]
MPDMEQAALDADLHTLTDGKEAWARTSIAERRAVLLEVKTALMPVAAMWAETAARHKRIPDGSPLVGEEWLSGPYALMQVCNELRKTLGQMEGKRFLNRLKTRTTVTGQLAVRVTPQNALDRIILSGITAEVWMQDGVSDLAANTANCYAQPPEMRKGKVALVLGAGNISSIAPLDCLHKLFTAHQVVLLKMNPVNDYLADILRSALAPLITRNALRIVTGGGETGAYLATHPLVDELHITGSEATHDAIIWGPGETGRANKAAGTPINTRRITSELGAVCPTIVVPGPWSAADIAFQAEHIATQKLHNSGFNCIACQMLILPEGWNKTEALMDAVTGVLATAARPAYYPGAGERLETFAENAESITRIARQTGPDILVADVTNTEASYYYNTEIFAPALSTYRISQPDPAAYLEAAIAFANTRLHGTLGANILIHPATIRKIGKRRFEEIIATLHYGMIAINAWSGIGFAMSKCPWGAYPGHRLDDVQSGIGVVHNTFLFDRPERSVITGPWRPFPRCLMHGELSL